MEEERESAIEVRGARKSYGKLEVLSGLDMNVPYASMYATRLDQEVTHIPFHRHF